MRKYLSAIILSFCVVTPTVAQSEHTNKNAVIPAAADTKCQWINGYYRKDGTWVSGHYRGC